MSGPSSSAIDNHLRRYEVSSDAGDDSDSSATGSTSCHRSAASSSPSRVKETFWSTVFADTSHPLASSVIARWWHQQQPLIVRFIREHGAIFVHFVTPFAPRAARRAGYCCASHDLLRTLDRVDIELPGGEGGWSSRWRSRCQYARRGAVLPGGISSVYTAVDGAGVAAVVVMVAAAVSWCSWRRSSPGWLLLLGEVAIGSAGLASFLAREDGHQEAKLLESHLVALEHSLGPFFRAVHACVRMVRCSQTLSFGLQLSVPMPPVARMEGRLSATGTSSRSGQPEMALRELRSVLMDVLEGGVEQANAFQLKVRCAGTTADDGNDGFSQNEGQASDKGNDRTAQFLADLAGREKQLVADLRRFMTDVAARVDEAVAGPEVWGLWWDSQLADVSEAVRELAEYFKAAGDRLKTAIGTGPPPFSVPSGASSSSEISAAAEALSSLRLHYEEALVRLYSCQSNAISVMRDPSKNTADFWGNLRQGLADARSATEALSCDNKLWRKAEDLVESNANGDNRSGADLGLGVPSSEAHSDTSRHLEAGVGWISLEASREEGPCVFEDGSCGEETKGTLRTTADTGVTDVLVGVPSPSRNIREGELNAASRTTPKELANERSRAQLVGELDTVLRARPLPPICEKHLPLESQHSLGEEDGSDMVAEQSVEQPIDVSPPPAAPAFPVAESIGSKDLMSELRAQLSKAANEEIFSSDAHHPAMSEDEEDGTLVGHEELHDEDASDIAPGPA
ncbi:unnamed protein product [Pylaiella littoralis]